MNRRSVFTALFFAAFLLLTGYRESPVSDEELSSFVLSPSILDFGRKGQQGPPVELSFTIQNQSNAPVVIEDIFSGRGCQWSKFPNRSFCRIKRLGAAQ